MHALARRSGVWVRLGRCSSSGPHVVLAEAAQLGLETRGWSQHRAGALVLAVSWGLHLPGRIAETSLGGGWIPRGKGGAAMPLEDLGSGAPGHLHSVAQSESQGQLDSARGSPSRWEIGTDTLQKVRTWKSGVPWRSLFTTYSIVLITGKDSLG